MNDDNNTPALLRAPTFDNPLETMARLAEKGISVESLNQLLTVHKEWAQEVARREYFAALARYKAEPPPVIVKKKEVRQRLRDRQTREYSGAEIRYKHETLDAVVAAVAGPLAKHGLSHSWSVRQELQGTAMTIYVRCVLTHELGYSEHVELWGSPDDSGHKNPLQQIRSTVTFLQRATLMLLLGLAAKGEDDDGGTSATERPEPRATATASEGKATAKQIGLIKKRLSNLGIKPEVMCEALSVESLDALPFDRVNEALAWIAKANEP